MRIKLIGDNIEITDEIRTKIENKLAKKLEKLLTDFNQDMKLAQMTLAKHSRWGWKINFDMRLPGKQHLFAEVRAEQLVTAITQIREKIISQIKELKGKLKNH